MNLAGIFTLANSVLIIIGAWRMIRVFWKKESSIKDTKKEFFHLIFILIVFGMIPGLPAFAMHTGEALMKPLTAIVDFITAQVTGAVNESVKGN
ncbi:hypothetical protein [Shimazuella kribbensis]|uniref:hypothetical protein n=1 Tax=Shimazuella kribbensis TaxID=139808 RepID=UPI00048C4BB8|nr:hypothetical protein [Shimazuella kribbensis]